MLETYISQKEHDWDVCLDLIIYAWNTSKNNFIGLSPNELVFGKLPRMPVGLELGVELRNRSSQTEYAETLRSVLRNATQIVKSLLEQVRTDVHRRPENPKWKPYDAGQVFWVKHPTMVRKKWPLSRSQQVRHPRSSLTTSKQKHGRLPRPC